MKLIKSVLVVSIVSLLLAGCGASNSGSAAVIGDVKIPESTLAQSFAEITEVTSVAALESTEDQLTRELLNRLVLLEIVRQAAVLAEVEVTPADVAAERSKTEADFGGPAQLTEAALAQAIAPRDINGVLELGLTISRIGVKLEPTGTQESQSAAFNTFILSFGEGLNVQISPRYGTWNAQQISVDAPTNPVAGTPGE
jgi:hypothetical protein